MVEGKNRRRRRKPILLWGPLVFLAASGASFFAGFPLHEALLHQKPVRILSQGINGSSHPGDGGSADDFTVKVEPVALFENSVTHSEKLQLSVQITNKRNVPQDFVYAFLIMNDRGQTIGLPTYSRQQELRSLSRSLQDLEIDSTGIDDGYYQAKFSIAVRSHNGEESGLIYPIYFQISAETITYLTNEEFLTLSRANTAI